MNKLKNYSIPRSNDKKNSVHVNFIAKKSYLLFLAFSANTFLINKNRYFKILTYKIPISATIELLNKKNSPEKDKEKYLWLLCNTIYKVVRFLLKKINTVYVCAVKGAVHAQ